ncbi:MAG: hypothetical protein ACYC6A_00885 [Armatimonadota bacterium]
MNKKPAPSTYQVTLSPPSWVDAEKTAREWAAIAHVRVTGLRRESRRWALTVEGAPGDVEIFARIVKLNSEKW